MKGVHSVISFGVSLIRQSLIFLEDAANCAKVFYLRFVICWWNCHHITSSAMCQFYSPIISLLPNVFVFVLLYFLFTQNRWQLLFLSWNFLPLFVIKISHLSFLCRLDCPCWLAPWELYSMKVVASDLMQHNAAITIDICQLHRLKLLVWLDSRDLKFLMVIFISFH